MESCSGRPGDAVQLCDSLQPSELVVSRAHVPLRLLRSPNIDSGKLAHSGPQPQQLVRVQHVCYVPCVTPCHKHSTNTGWARVCIVHVAVCWLLYTIVQYVWWPLRKYSPSPCSCISDSRLLLFRRHRDCGVSAPWCSGNVGGVRAGGNGALTPPRPGNGCSAASGPRGQVTNTTQQPHGETGETARHQRRTLNLIEPRRLSSSHYQRPCKCLGQKGCRKCGGGEQGAFVIPWQELSHVANHLVPAPRNVADSMQDLKKS